MTLCPRLPPVRSLERSLEVTLCPRIQPGSHFRNFYERTVGSIPEESSLESMVSKINPQSPDHCPDSETVVPKRYISCQKQTQNNKSNIKVTKYTLNSRDRVDVGNVEGN